MGVGWVKDKFPMGDVGWWMQEGDDRQMAGDVWPIDAIRHLERPVPTLVSSLKLRGFEDFAIHDPRFVHF